MKRFLSLIFLALTFVFFFARPAWAYLNPGTGSLIMQVIVAIFVGGFTALRSFRMAVINVIKKIFGKRKGK